MAQELKAYIAPTPDGTGLADYYLKSEADKVIAEKDKEIAELKQKLDKTIAERDGNQVCIDAFKDELRWRKYPDEKPDVKVDEGVCLLVVVEVQDDYNPKKGRYVTEAECVLQDGEIPECVFYRTNGGEIEEDFVQIDGKRYISKVIMWRPLPKAPELAEKFKEAK